MVIKIAFLSDHCLFKAGRWTFAWLSCCSRWADGRESSIFYQRNFGGSTAPAYLQGGASGSQGDDDFWCMLNKSKQFHCSLPWVEFYLPPLQPENIMVDLRAPTQSVKLIDLGDAVQLSANRRYVHLLLGNPEFAAPELIRGTPVSVATDLWSMGVLAYVMLSGVSPFLDESPEETCVNICRLDFCFPDEYFQHVSEAARDFVSSVLKEDPRKRPNATLCLQHPWVGLRGAQGAEYSKTPLDRSRLATFIDRRRQLHDVRPITNIKGLVSSSMGNTLWWRKQWRRQYSPSVSTNTRIFSLFTVLWTFGRKKFLFLSNVYSLFCMGSLFLK